MKDTVLAQVGRNASVSWQTNSALSCGSQAIQNFNLAKQSTGTDSGAVPTDSAGAKSPIVIG
jgi:hypothetical protein